MKMQVLLLSFQVRIDEIRGKSPDYFPCGVVKINPDSLKLPATALDGWKDAIVFSDVLFRYGSQVMST